MTAALSETIQPWLHTEQCPFHHDPTERCDCPLRVVNFLEPDTQAERLVLGEALGQLINTVVKRAGEVAADHTIEIQRQFTLTGIGTMVRCNACHYVMTGFKAGKSLIHVHRDMIVHFNACPNLERNDDE